MIVDFHIHLGRDFDGQSTTIDQISKELSRSNIGKAVMFPFNSVDLLGDSRKILELSKEYTFVVPFLRFDPKSITPKDLDDALTLGYKGVKLHPTSQTFYPDYSRFRWIYERIMEQGLPILFHCSTSVNERMSQPERILNLADRYPQQVFVLAHSIGGEAQPFSKLSCYPNVYVDTSVDAYVALYERVYDMFGFDKFVFGSDYPYSHPDIELEKIKRARIPDTVKEKILYGNAVHILKL